MTIIEVLVVLSVIALLLALVLPAVQAVRESQRKQLCQTRLIEIGRALQTFEGIYRVYPAAMASEAAVALNPSGQTSRWISPHTRLLPYLDQAPLFEKFKLNEDHSYSPPFDPSVGVPVGGASSSVPGRDLRLPIFLCPSDSATYNDKTNNNFRANLGRGPGSAYKGVPGLPDPDMVVANGAFTLGHSLTSGDFKDGLSFTIAFSERLRGDGSPNDYSRKRDIFYSGVATLYPNGGLTLGDLETVCNSVSDTTTEFYPYAGGSWFYAGYDQTWYNHALVPNSPTPDCAEESLPRMTGPKTTYAILGSRSLHSQGVNCVYMHGNGKFISNNIDRSVWWAISSRAGSEQVDLSH